MRLVPFRYTVRSLVVRWSPSLFSALGIGLTVAVLGGVLALREGFQSIVAETGADDVAVYLRPGAQSEGESIVRHPQDTAILRTREEVALAPDGQPLAASESYLGLKLERSDGTGTTIVTVRGVELPASVRIQGPKWRIVEGSEPTPGSDEVVVGRPLTTRIKDTTIGSILTFNVTPFKVVGVFENDGAYASEIWGDVDRICAALERPFRQRFVAKVRPGTDLVALGKELETDKRVPLKVVSERAYFAAQTTALGGVLQFLASVLTTLMGAAAVLGAVNTMLAAVGARTREVGILMSIGYRAVPVFLCFLFEAALIGLAGGVLGALLVLPFNGIQTSTTNWNTFTEIAFAFRVTPRILVTSVAVALVLGVLGGAVPAWRASRLVPTAALRRL